MLFTALMWVKSAALMKEIFLFFLVISLELFSFFLSWKQTLLLLVFLEALRLRFCCYSWRFAVVVDCLFQFFRVLSAELFTIKKLLV